jgi:clan AA aspartic protease (TIGR02281 family)
MTRSSCAAVLVVVAAAAVAPGCASVKDAVVDVDGSEVADVKDAHADAIWLPLQQPLLQHSLDVVVLVDGQPVVATLDTGAMVTAMSSTLAQRLGLAERVAQSTDHMPITDAHGQAGQASRVLVSTLGFAQQWIDNAAVWVFPSERETFLIGMDHLQRYDLYLVVDQGYVGLFPAGQGPKDDDDTVIPLIAGERSLQVRARAPGARGTAEATMVVDTGAEFSMSWRAPAR